MFRERPDGTVECDFLPGQESAAASYLAVGPSAEAIRIEPEVKRPGYLALRLAVNASVGIVVGFFLTLLLWEGVQHDEEMSDVFVFLILCGGVVVWRLAELIVRDRRARTIGWFALEPGAQTLLIGRRRIPFSDLGVPRRTRVGAVSWSLGLGRPSATEFIELEVDGEEPLILFEGYPVKDLSGFDMDSLALRINAALVEFHERQAIQQWLEQRSSPPPTPGADPIPSTVRQPRAARVGSSLATLWFGQTPIGETACQFSPGEEALARKYLLQQPRARPVRIGADRLVSLWSISPRALLVLGLGLMLPFVVDTLVSGLFASRIFSPIALTVAVLGMAPAMAGTIQLIMRRSFGRFIVDPRRAIVIYGKRRVQFDQLGLIRRAHRIVGDTVFDGPATLYAVDELVEVRVVGEEPLLLFRHRLRGVGPEQLDQLADQLNLAALEFRERAAVRRWLGQRRG